jgi:Zn-dependent protease
MGSSFSSVQLIVLLIIPLMFGVVVHEVAHGWVAWKFGDPTAKMLGRLTLNPIKHIDLFGTIIIPIILVMAGGLIFGWAKPVPVDGRNFKNYRRDMFLVTMAGPFTNFLMACGWFALLAGILTLQPSATPLMRALTIMADYGVKINIVLMVLNSIPIPPLDGGKALICLLPGHLSWKLSRFEPYGFFILVALIFTGVLGVIFHPFFVAYQDLLRWVLQ